MPLSLGAEEARQFDDGEAPGPHLDFLHAAAFRMAGAALELGVFEALGDVPLPAAEVARRLSADERGVRLLLEALESFGYVARTDDGYVSSPMAARWMRRDAPGSYAVVHDFWRAVLLQLWDNLEESLRRGRPPRDFFAWLEEHPATLRDFQTMLRRLAGWLADEIVTAAPLPAGARRLLDLGGGHGLYSLAYCRRYPELTATIIDLPGALALGRETVAAAGLENRIVLHAADYATADLGSGYDVALLFNVVHSHLPARNVELLRGVATAVKPGGVLLLLELLADLAPDLDRSTTAFVRTFSLNLFHLLGGQTYPFADLAGWLSTAGFGDARRIDLTAAPDNSLVLAVRAG